MHAPIVVQKYGGSSVADTTRIKRVAQRIVATREAGKQVVVVVSAMADTTDDLLSSAREITESPSRRELDMLLTCGERASMALLSMAVNELGHEAISFTGSQCGIMTNDRHSGARIVEVRPVRVQDELAAGRIVIVAGFQGVSYKREITTLGRGGSDTTAVALAAALGADYCEICSDVDGVLSADPREVDAAQLIGSIGHDEMTELAAHGAKVLHVDSVDYARRAGIALYARRTDGEGSGTRIGRIDRDLEAREKRASGVAHADNLALLRFPVASGALARLAARGASFLACLVSGEEGAVVLDPADLPQWSALRSELLELPGVFVKEPVCAVTLIGSAVGSEAECLSQLANASDELGAKVLVQVSSYLRVSVVVECEFGVALSRRLHDRFVGHE